MLTKRGLIAARRLPGPRESEPRLSRIRKHRTCSIEITVAILTPWWNRMSERIGNITSQVKDYYANPLPREDSADRF